MDARDMADLETGSFDAVIDKGLTDSVMYNDNFATMMAKVRLVCMYYYGCTDRFTRENQGSFINRAENIYQVL